MKSSLSNSGLGSRIEEWLDGLAFGSALLMAILLAAMLQFWTPTVQQLFFDPGSVPWDELWEALKTLGAGAAVARGAFWAKRKLSGEDKYFRAIYDVLDSSAKPLTRAEVEARVRKRISDDPKFSERFDRMWHEMRKQGYIEKIGAVEKPDSDPEPLYELNEKRGKAGDKA